MANEILGFLEKEDQREDFPADRRLKGALLVWSVCKSHVRMSEVCVRVRECARVCVSVCECVCGRERERERERESGIVSFYVPGLIKGEGSRCC